MDYQSNSRKNREEPKPKKELEKVVITGEVIRKPRAIGTRFKDIFLGGDVRDASKYVLADVLLPALRNMLWDVWSQGGKRYIYGDSPLRRRPTDYSSTTRYNNPINPVHTTYYGSGESRPRLPDQPHPHRQVRRDVDRIIMSSREEAERAIEIMIDSIDKYDSVSLADFYEIIGEASTPADNNWGWRYLNNAEVRQVSDGYLISLPPMEDIR